MYAVALEQIQYHYNGTPVLKDLNLNLKQGEVLGLFGHNGAGKTTSIKLILGLMAPAAGKVTVLGLSPGDHNARLQMGYLPENVNFYPQLTGRETLRHFARLKHATVDQSESLLAQVGLLNAADRRVKTYSKGMRQRLGLAQALLGNPKLLLLDEPTVGLDPIATQDLYKLIEKLREQGTSVILCSHVLPGVEPLVDRVAILNHGQLQAVGTLTELRHQADLPIRIRCEGVSDCDKWIAHFEAAGAIVHKRPPNGLELFTDASKKMAILHTLFNQAELTDVDVVHPGLEDLYGYFVTHAEHLVDKAGSR